MFAKLVKCVLAPMLPGAVVDDQEISIDPAVDIITYDPTTNTLALSPAKGAKKALHIHRKQRFHRTELALARSFIRASAFVRGAEGQPFEQDVLRHFPERVITMAVAAEARRTAMGILVKFDEWAASSYEGKRVSAAIGIQCEPETSVSGMLDVKLSELLTEPYAPILTNGLDTMLVVSSNGIVQSVQAVDATQSAPFAPLRYAGVAEWSDGSYCTLCLSRSGDVLLFVNGALCFARRRTSWHHYTHEVVLEHLDSLVEVVRTAMYETLLDASFARSGACIAIVPDDRESEVAEFVSERDSLTNWKAPSVKTRLVTQTIGTQFQYLDRRVRLSLTEFDGATIITTSGKLLAVGAIVRIEAGSTGGGRLAATRTLSKLGLAIKVSQDGTISGFRSGGQDPVFVLG